MSNYWTWIITQGLFSFFIVICFVVCVCFAVFPVARMLLRRLCYFNKLPKQQHHKKNVCFGTNKTDTRKISHSCLFVTPSRISQLVMYLCVYVYIYSVYVYSGLGVYIVDFAFPLLLDASPQILLNYLPLDQTLWESFLKKQR